MRKHGKYREKGTNFTTGNLEKFVDAKRHMRVALFGTARTQERRGRGARAAPGKKNCVRSDINQKN